MSFKFEKLIIWQDSMSFAETIFKMTLNFPKEEIYNLTSQIRRASDSIALNISEGSNLEFKKFLGYSIRSVAEVVTCLYKAKNRNYIDENSFQDCYNFAYKLMNHIIAFKNKLN